jgi:hypothetical protein
MEQHDPTSGKESQQIKFWESGSGIHDMQERRLCPHYFGDVKERVLWVKKPTDAEKRRGENQHEEEILK